MSENIEKKLSLADIMGGEAARLAMIQGHAKSVREIEEVSERITTRLEDMLDEPGGDNLMREEFIVEVREFVQARMRQRAENLQAVIKAFGGLPRK